MSKVYSMIQSSMGRKVLFALLIDPDKHTAEGVKDLVHLCEYAKVDMILLGGSLVRTNMEDALGMIKQQTHIPVVLFPGNSTQFCKKADAIFLLSLISGRNPEYLIGNHVIASHAIKESGMEVIPTGYILIDSGVSTSVQYMSNTMPIPSSKIDIAVATALAGEQLGLKAIYLEAGSGAKRPVPNDLIKAVKKNIEIPLIVGGGLRSSEHLIAARKAGANVVVVSNAIECKPELLAKLVKALH